MYYVCIHTIFYSFFLEDGVVWCVYVFTQFFIIFFRNKVITSTTKTDEVCIISSKFDDLFKDIQPKDNTNRQIMNCNFFRFFSHSTL